jgi:oxidase EvaA
MVSSDLLTSKEEVASWLALVRASERFEVAPMPLDRSHAWSHDDGIIRHASGRFFGIIGLTWTEAAIPRWQPFIDQREIGTLGFIARHREKEIDLLVQAKTEPGNVGIVQLAPTCQATASNQECIHGGEPPPYSRYFSGSMGKVISDSLQSEQGMRFFGKLNRNILVLDDRVEAKYGQHRWIPLVLFKQFLIEDFMVNTDARSVLCTTDWKHLLRQAGPPEQPFQGDDDFSQGLKKSFCAPVRKEAVESVRAALRVLRENAPETAFCPLDAMPGWRLDAGNPTTITDGKLSIRHIHVHAQTREVNEWDQPIFDNHFEQMVDLDCGWANGVIQFAFRAYWEPGLRAGVELGPTRIMGAERSAGSAGHISPGKVRLSVRQSDEGGRFFRDIAEYRVIDVGEVQPKDGLIQLTLSEMACLLPQGIFNNEARSAISLLLSLA